jgi:hypothetical protein
MSWWTVGWLPILVDKKGTCQPGMDQPYHAGRQLLASMVAGSLETGSTVAF